MALELTIVKETHPAESFIIADGNSVEKGSLMKFTDPFTVAISDGDTDIIAGVLKIEKVANSGIVQAAVWTKGTFKGFAGAAGVTVGAALISDVATGAPNEIVNADVNSENMLGRSLETATDTQSFLLELNPFTVNLA